MSREVADAIQRRRAADEPMDHGVIKWFSAEKGFGFITPRNGGGDVFVHITAFHEAGINGIPTEGMRVSYTTTMQRGRPAATDIRLD